MAVFTSVFPDQHVVDHMRDHDDFVGEERACGLAQAECRFGRHAPFVPVVVRPVVGEYDFHSQQTGQRCQQCRAHRMEVDDVGFQAFGPHDGPERVDDCFERFFPRRFDVRERDALVAGQRVAYVTFPPYNGYLEAFSSNTRKQLFTMCLHASHDIRNAAGSGDDYFHVVILRVLVRTGILTDDYVVRYTGAG